MDTQHFEVHESKFTVSNKPFTAIYLRGSSSMRGVAADTWRLFGPDTEQRYEALGSFGPYLHYVNYKRGNPVLVLPQVEVRNGVPNKRVQFVNTNKPWTLLPISVWSSDQGHGHAILLLKRKEHIYLFDPNGVSKRPTQSLDLRVLEAFRVVLSELGVKGLDFGDTSHHGPWLLTNDFQHEALRFLDSSGLCEAFVTSIGIFVILNPHRKRRDIVKFFSHRQHQWASSSTAIQTLAYLATTPLDILAGRPLRPVQINKRDRDKAIQACRNNDLNSLQTMMRFHPFLLAFCPSLFPKSYVKGESSFLLNTLSFPGGLSDRRSTRAELISKGFSLSFVETFVILHVAYLKELADEHCCSLRHVLVVDPKELAGTYSPKETGVLYNQEKNKTISYFVDRSRGFPSVLWVIGDRRHALKTSSVLYGDTFCFSPFPPWTNPTLEWKRACKNTDAPIKVTMHPYKIRRNVNSSPNK